MEIERTSFTDTKIVVDMYRSPPGDAEFTVDMGRGSPGDADFRVNLHGAPRLTMCKRERYWSSNDYDETLPLGKGGFGCVVEAHHKTSGWTVAVKKARPCPHEGGDNTYACSSDADMLCEAAFLAACNGHHAIVELRGISHDPFSRKLSVVMERVRDSLHSILECRSTPFPEANVRSIMQQLLCAAKHMHRLIIIHRDIKSANILLGAGGISEVKICDMGIAISLSEPPPYGKYGTPGYMALELLLVKTDYDTAVDFIPDQAC